MPEAVRDLQAAEGEERLLLVALFLFALLVRVIMIAQTIGFHTPGTAEPAADSRIHLALVQSLLTHHGYSLNGRPTAITPPLYVFFLASLYRASADPALVRFVQAFLGAMGCVLLYAIGRRLVGPTTGVVAAVILGLHPLIAYLAGLHLTENLFLFLLLLVLLQSQRVAERPTPLAVAGLGGLFGLATLTRAVFLGFLPFVLVWAIGLWGWRNPVGYRVFALVAVAAAIVILPWTVRNYVALGALVPVQGNGGMVFWAGNNPRSDGQMVWPTGQTWADGPPPDDGMYGWRGVGPAEENRRYVGAAVSWIRHHPRDYLRLLAHKLERLYGFSRAADARELAVPFAVIAFHVGLLVAALGGLVVTVRRWKSVALLLGLIVFTNLTALLFSGGTRYSVPMMPSLIILAAAALTTAWSASMRPLGATR
ncbi:MAG TPA: glycosyltransferase family 39 protein [bacterium]|nr:glycosyltransferase family 39 protein [bacterium]